MYCFSFSSMDAQYCALPQSPNASPDIGIPSAIEEGDMTIEDIDDSILDKHVACSAPVTAGCWSRRTCQHKRGNQAI
jgi:hypothetical protein